MCAYSVNNSDFLINLLDPKYLSLLEKVDPENDYDQYYYCPYCGGNNFTFNKNDGRKFTCHAPKDPSCSNKNISKTLHEKAGDNTGNKTNGFKTITKRQQRNKPTPIPVDAALILSDKIPVPTTVGKPVKTYSHVLGGEYWEVTLYHYYSNTQRKVRREAYSSAETIERVPAYKGEKDKTFSFQHLDTTKPCDERDWSSGGGSLNWHFYKQEEALRSPSRVVLAHEGEKKADYAWSIGLPSFSFKYAKDKKKELVSFKDAGKVIVIISDNSEDGRNQANQFYDECVSVGVPSLVYDLREFYPDLEETGDIVDVINNNEDNSKIGEQLAQDILSRIKEQTLRTVEDASEVEEGLYLEDWINLKYSKLIRYNSISMKIELNGEPINIDRIYYQEKPKARLDRVKDLNEKDFIGFLIEEAYKNEYNPLAEYLESTRNSKPVSLDNLATRYFGTINPLYNTMLKKWLIASVARVKQAGCKVDNLLVLLGDPSIGKTTFFETLFKGSVYLNIHKFNDKDEVRILYKNWLGLIDEIDKIYNKKDAAELKDFITRTRDTVRPAYAKDDVEFPRRSMLAGTTNNPQFLVDLTGNRRYWIIQCGNNKIDIDQLLKERDGIWHSALLAYESDEKWWMSSEDEKQVAEVNESHLTEDTWLTKIKDYVAVQTSVTTIRILEDCLGVEVNRQTNADAKRVGACLRKLGYERKGGKSGRRWVKEDEALPLYEKLEEPPFNQDAF